MRTFSPKRAETADRRIKEAANRGGYGPLDAILPLGVITTQVDGRLLCHFCGRAYLFLGSHAFAAHGLLGDEYKDLVDVPRGTSLFTAVLTHRMAETMRRRHHNEGVAAFGGIRPTLVGRVRSPDTRKADQRAAARRNAAHPDAIKGTRNPMAKLTEDQVEQARQLRRKGLLIAAIAEQLHVSQSTISSILAGKTWGGEPVMTPSPWRPTSRSGGTANRTHCSNGHPWTTPGKCLACGRIYAERSRRKRGVQPKHLRVARICPIDGREFLPNHPQNMYCSRRCSVRGQPRGAIAARGPAASPEEARARKAELY